MLSQDYYSEYCRTFSSIERYLRKYAQEDKRTFSQICNARGYYLERMEDILRKAGFFYIENVECTNTLRRLSSDYALFGKDGKFLLEGRYIFPVRDMLGNTITLIGWYPCAKKYITLPTRMFSKSSLFYGMEQLNSTGIGKKYFLTEGIFDTLSLRSLGYNAIAQMGIDSSRYKSSMYTMFSRLVGVPDNDSEGREVIGKDKWVLPSNSSYFRWIGDSSKDIDSLINSYEEEDLKDLLNDVMNDKKRVITRRI